MSCELDSTKSVSTNSPLPRMSDREATRELLDDVLSEMLRTGKGGEQTVALSRQRRQEAGVFSRVSCYWIFSLFTMKGRPMPVIPMFIYLTYAAAVISVMLYAVGEGTLNDIYNFRPEMKDVSIIFGFALFLVLSFRMNNAYQRWYDGAQRFAEITSLVQNGVRMDCAILPTEQVIDLMWWLFAGLFSAKQQLRGLYGSENFKLLEKAMPPRLFKGIADRRDKFHWSMYHYHKIVTRINFFRATEDRGVQEALRITIPMVAAYGACVRIIETPFPFGYVSHLRVFLIVWLAILPFAFVVSYGWWSMCLAFVACFGVLGIEEAATEIEMPFGNDTNDLSLDYMADDAFKLLVEFLLFVGFDEEGNSLEAPSGDKLC